VILLTRDVGDASALPAAVAAGGLVALLALLVLTVAETDEAFANAYSGAVSLQNLFPAAPQKLLIVATTTVGTIGALVLELTSFQSLLILLGSFFVPLFAVLLADWLLAGLSYDAHDVFGAPAWRPGMILAWVVGFGTYQYLSPTGPTWWVDQVQHVDPPDWGIGATLPSFAAALLVGLVAAAASRRRARTLASAT
jgi:purine-cytosine permease-like protein